MNWWYSSRGDPESALALVGPGHLASCSLDLILIYWLYTGR